MTKEQLIRLIHVAKTQLGLDDETYRALLLSQTKKDSCSKMLKHELDKIYDSMKAKGFNYTGVKKKHSKPKVKIADRRDDIKKIKAIWITMGQQGFITDSSDKTLDGYVERMTKKYSNGLGIKCVAWLSEDLTCHVLEALKKWHLRCIVNMLEQIPHVIIHGGRLLLNGNYYRGYDAIADFYRTVLDAKKQFGSK